MRQLPRRPIPGACPSLLPSLVAVALLMLSTPLAATPLCRWMDDSGRTHFSELVPEQYQKGATCTDSMRYELTPEQARAAEQKAAEARAGDQRDAAARPSPASSAASGAPRGAASRPVEKRPAELVTDSTDCATWWRLYDASMACFGPYRTTRGATRVEAFDVCNVVASPELRCGPRRD